MAAGAAKTQDANAITHFLFLISYLPAMSVIPQLILIGLANGGAIALNAIAITVIYSAVRALNLAHGDVYALSSVMSMVILRDLVPFDQSMPVPELLGALALALAASIALSIGLSVMIEFLAFRVFRGQSRLAPIIATLGLSFVLYQAALVWRKLMPTFLPGEHRSVPGLPLLPHDGVPRVLPQLNVAQGLGLSLDIKDFIIIVAAIAVALGVHVLIKSSRIGKAIRASAQNPLAAQMAGVNLNATIRAAFVIGGALAGLAGFIFTITMERPVGVHGAESSLVAFTAAILGGIGSPFGALLSSGILGMFQSFSDFYLDGRWTPALLNALLVGLLVLRPNGFSAEERDDFAAAPQSDVMSLGAMRPSTALKPRTLLLTLLPLAILYPLLVPLMGEYYLPVINNALIWVSLALGLTVLLGFAGVVDVGYGLNFAIGAYLAAYLTGPGMAWRAGLPAFLFDGVPVFIVVVLVTGFIGILKGLLTARMRPDYLAIATLALGMMLRDVLKNSSVGGVDGFAAIPPPKFFGVVIASHGWQYALMLVVVTALVVGSYRLLNSRVGRALAALREDEYAATSSGVNVAKYKTIAFFTGDAIAGVCGALYALLLSIATPDLADFWTSVMVLAMVAVGGVGNIGGAVLGALAILGIDRIAIPALQTQMEAQNFIAGFNLRELSFLLFGLALYLSVLGSRGLRWRAVFNKISGALHAPRLAIQS